MKDSPDRVPQPRGLYDLDDGLPVIPVGRFLFYGRVEGRRLVTRLKPDRYCSDSNRRYNRNLMTVPMT